MTASREVSQRITLLSGQAFAMGLTLAWVTIPGNTIFLERFGAGLLPVTYIGAALAGIAASVLLGRAFRRRPVTTVAARLLLVVITTLAATWGVVASDGTWLSFVIMVLLPITLPIGFMFVVGQASLLLDLRVMKAMYAKVIAGFALGFTVGGLAAAPLLEAVGGTEQLFVAAALAATVLLVLVLVTARVFPTELSVVGDDEQDAGRPSAPPSPLTKRFILLIMGFQMLSAVESQWLDYLMYDRAAARYPDERDLAEFVGRFSAITYGTDIIFLLLIAGVLLRRFGLRLGLLANSGFVLTMVLVVLATTAATASGATVVFVLVVSTRVSDLVLSDGTSRTSVSAAYQAIPAPNRLAAQARVESLGVPVAIGASGAVLLVVQATVGTQGPVLLLLVAVVLAAWVVCSGMIYADYRRTLLDGLRHHVLEPTEVIADDAGALAVAEDLLGSDDPRDVRLGLDAIAATGSEDTVAHLVRLVAGGREDIYEEVMRRLLVLDGRRAASLARGELAHPSATVRAVSLEVVARAGDPIDTAVAMELLDDPDPRVEHGAAAVVDAFGGDADRRTLMAVVDGLATSTDPADRELAASILGACRTTSAPRRLLSKLLTDESDDVAASALAAMRAPIEPDLVPTVLDLLERRGTASAASDLLVSAGTDGLTAITRRLAESSTASGLAHVTRVCRRIGGERARLILRRLVEHVDRDVGLAALRAMAPDAATPLEPTEEAWRQRFVVQELVHATRLLLAMDELSVLESAGPLRAALVDEARLVRQRLVATLALRHGLGALGRVELRLAHADPRTHATALEWLDVTLTGAERPMMVLVDPSLSGPARARVLAKALAVDRVVTADLLRDIVEDRAGIWRRPWLTACAIVAAAGAPMPGPLDVSRSLGPSDPDGIVAETIADLARSGRTTPISS